MHSLRIVGVAGTLFMILMGCASPSSDTHDGVTGDDANQTSDKVLLDCNVFESGGGPDQEVVIAKRSSGLVMKELTNHGSWEERPLDQEEWDKHDLKLRHDRWDGPDTVNRLYKDDEGEWRNESLSDGFNVYGYAYCFKDES